MDFGFSEEQEMLRESASRFLAGAVTRTEVRRAMEHATAQEPELWRKVSELGWPGLMIPESYGGQGGSFLDLVVILEETGKVLLPGPLFATALLGSSLLLEGGSEVQKRALLPKLAKGETIATLAVAEAAGRWEASGIELRAEAKDNHYILSGEKSFVHDAHVADVIGVAARSSRTGRPEDGISLFLVPAGAPGLTITQLKTVDSTRRLCHLKFDKVRVEAEALLGQPNQGWPILRRVLDLATAGLCAEMVGTGQRSLDMAVEYAKTRVQFGKPIGSFQAVKHKCVDMMVLVENARSLTYYACWTVEERNTEVASAVAMAKAYTSDMAKWVSSEAIQVHGGIGFTWEHDIHLYHRRALAGESCFGNAPLHRENVARSLPLWS